MLSVRIPSAIILLAAAVMIVIVNPTSAATKGKKLTLEQAWAICKAEVDSKFTKMEHNARYVAGGACLLRHGYRI